MSDIYDAQYAEIVRLIRAEWGRDYVTPPIDTSARTIHAIAYRIYCHMGQSAVELWARRNLASHPIDWRRCEPCDDVEPVLADVCMICFTEARSAA